MKGFFLAVLKWKHGLEMGARIDKLRPIKSFELIRVAEQRLMKESFKMDTFLRVSSKGRSQSK